MTSLLPETRACMNGHGDSGVSEINSALLISLLDESQGEDCDDERLRSVIQSLEQEIDPQSMNVHNADVHNDCEDNLEGSQLPNVGQLDAQHRFISYDLDTHWMDMEIAPSSPSGFCAMWYNDSGEDEIDGVFEFEGVRDFSYGNYMDEEYHEYGSLWLQ